MIKNPILDISVQDDKVQPISPTFARIGGNSHADGGTNVEVLNTGERIEAQKNEPISKQTDGSLVAWGKMKNPHTGNTFERDANILAELENRSQKMMDKANKLAKDTMEDTIQFSTAKVLMDAAAAKDIDTTIKKEIYAKTQQDILDVAQATNTDAKKLSNRIAKNGATMNDPLKVKVRIVSVPMAANGATLDSPPATYSNAQVEEFRKQGNWGQNVFDQAVENTKWFDPNLPSNISGYQQYWTKNYPELVQQSFNPNTFSNPFPNTNKGYAKYPVEGSALTPEQSLYAFQDNLAGNRNIQVKQRTFSNQQELDNWMKGKTPINSNNKQFYPTNEAGVYEIPSLSTRPQIEPLYDKGSDARLNQARMSDIQPMAPIDTSNPQNQEPTPVNRQPVERTSLADQNRFNLMGILPEIAAVLDRPDFVPRQEFRPQYSQPYQVTFQDRVNQGTAEFNRIQSATQNDPLALATMAAQQRRASDNILADEFRTNQAIESSIYNQNQQLFNQATLQNMRLADQQFMRQEQARANTEQARQSALRSISSKVLRNRAENNAIRLLENFSDFRVDNKMRAVDQNEPKQVTDAQGNIWSVSPETWNKIQEERKKKKNLN